MREIEEVLSLYKIFNEHNMPHKGEKEHRLRFLSEYIIGLDTDDSDMSVELGEMILETLNHIKDKTIYKYIENEENYKNYIISCNFIRSWIETTTSMRCVVFDDYYGKIKTKIRMFNTEYIPITDEFINWFIEWLNYNIK